MSKDSEKGQRDKARGKGHNPPASSISERFHAAVVGGPSQKDKKRISDYNSGYKGTKKTK